MSNHHHHMAYDMHERRPLLEDVEKSCVGDSNLAATPTSQPRRWRRRIVPLLCAALGAVALYCLATPSTPYGFTATEAPHRIRRHRPGRKYDAFTAVGGHGAVATENEICSDMGVEVLRKGGNALDAAITATLCVGTTNMFSSGIGGGGFINIRAPRTCSLLERRQGLLDCADHMTVDFRETAPAASNASMFDDEDASLSYLRNASLGEGRKHDKLFARTTSLKSKIGGLAVAVPGEVRGLEEAWRRWGSKKPQLGWEDLITPVAQLATEGWKVPPLLEQRLVAYQNLTRLFTARPEWSAIFTNNGSLKRTGDRIARPAYGASLSRIAKEGSDAFYYGEIAQSMVDEVQRRGGILTMKDLDEYKVHVVPAIEGRWGSKRVWTTPAPSSGPVLLSMLRIIGLWGQEFATDPSWASSLTAHRLVETLKMGFGQRTHLADPAFLNATNRAKIDTIAFDAAESSRLHAKLSDDQTRDTRTQEGLRFYEPIFDITENHGTMSLSVMDEAGMAVVVTSTVNLPFGSQVLDAKTGIIMGDEMDDFSAQGQPNGFGLWPSPFNYPGPGKRPMSSMAPTIVEQANGTAMLAVGGSGGSRIFPAVLQTMLNLDWGLDLSGSIEAPRLHHQLLPYTIEAEATFPPELLARLREKGHEHVIIDINEGWAVVQAVQRTTDEVQPRFIAASDSRKAGVATAF